ncbi:MAG TPA: DNA adenine methylase [Candidatus Bathyarchaeia archaeon]|nr:DNA adenine methylase [Candidatus Bathyarchaeia archaeon]
MLVQGFVDLGRIRPFVKWAGGKAQLLRELDKMIPQFNRYFEPFLSGGAMFFYLIQNRRFIAYLSDTNKELITTYKVVKDYVGNLIEFLDKHQEEYKKNPFQYFYRLRAAQPNNDIEKAARFIALNKTCFNGLYRVNKKGEFNVPIGDYKDPLICDKTNLEKINKALSKATVFAADYSNVTGNAKQGDFVYLDPPYDPVSSTSNFTGYTSNGFGSKNQEQLADVFETLVSKGCLVLLSNSDTPFIRDLYSDFRIKEVGSQRAINCKGSKRAGHKELLISNYC